MKKQYLFIFGIFLFLLIFPLINAKQSPQIEGNLLIDYPKFDYHKQNTVHEFNFHVINLTGLKTNVSTDCDFHLYDLTGTHLLFQDLDFGIVTNQDYSIVVGAGNFSNRGNYDYKVVCEDGEAGIVSASFTVNKYGEELTQSTTNLFYFGIFILFAFLIISLFGIFNIDNYIGKFVLYWVCHVLFIIIVFSVWQFIDGYAISTTTTIGIFKILFYVSITAMFPMILLSVAWIFYIHTMNDIIKGMMERGMDEETATKKAKEKKKW